MNVLFKNINIFHLLSMLKYLIHVLVIQQKIIKIKNNNK